MYYRRRSGGCGCSTIIVFFLILSLVGTIASKCENDSDEYDSDGSGYEDNYDYDNDYSDSNDYSDGNDNSSGNSDGGEFKDAPERGIPRKNYFQDRKNLYNNDDTDDDNGNDEDNDNYDHDFDGHYDDDHDTYYDEYD